MAICYLFFLSRVCSSVTLPHGLLYSPPVGPCIRDRSAMAGFVTAWMALAVWHAWRSIQAQRRRKQRRTLRWLLRSVVRSLGWEPSLTWWVDPKLRCVLSDGGWSRPEVWSVNVTVADQFHRTFLRRATARCLRQHPRMEVFEECGDTVYRVQHDGHSLRLRLLPYRPEVAPRTEWWDCLRRFVNVSPTASSGRQTGGRSFHGPVDCPVARCAHTVLSPLSLLSAVVLGVL